MKALIVSSSRSPRRNTQQVADLLGSVLDAEVITPDRASPALLAGVDLIGFGSGIYYANFARDLLESVQRLPSGHGARAFSFATSGLPERTYRRSIRAFGHLLTDHGFTTVGHLACRGLDTWGPFALVGGVSRGHPNDDDFASAQRFAARLRSLRE